MRPTKKRGCFLEATGQPDRMDLQAVYCRMARDDGVMVSVTSDAHSVYAYACLDYGVAQRRRGWLSAADVVNTRGLPALRMRLKRTL
jgi:DNA polymerase (family X)